MVLGVILLAFLGGMLAFGIDVGFVKATHSELQRCSDAAAMAGCWQMYEQKTQNASEEWMLYQVGRETQLYAAQNMVLGARPVLMTGNEPDFQIGTYDWSTGSFRAGANTPSDYNAVRVVVKRTANSNGPVPLFFASLFGYSSHELTSTAIAAMSDRVNGFYLPPGSEATVNMMPFALDQESWEAMLAGEADDEWSYDPMFGVSPGSDGVFEVNLYPQETGAPGNRGTVDIGGGNNSTSDLGRQIVHGVSAGDLAAMDGPLQIPSPYEPLLLEGDPGISAGIKDELASIVGKTRVIPIFSDVSGNGNNSTYSIVRFVGVRVLDVQLTGQTKQVIVQPAVTMSRGVTISDVGGAAPSQFIYTPVSLVY